MATGHGLNRWVVPFYAGIVLGAAALIGLGWWPVP